MKEKIKNKMIATQKDILRRNIVLDYLYTFINNLNMTSCVWVLYLTYRGLNLMEIGLVEGIYHLTSILCEVPSGAVADLMGRKKTIIAGRICIAISCIIMLFSKHLYGFAIAFMIQAFGNNLNSGSEEALLYDSIKMIGSEDKYLKIISHMNVLVEISQAIATVVGGVIAEYSYEWCYITCIVIAVLSLIPTLFFMEPPIHKECQLHKDGIRSMLKQHFQTSYQILRDDHRITKLVTFYSVVFATYTMLFFYSQQYFYDHGLNKIEISMIMLFLGGVSCIGAILSEKLYLKFRDRLVFIAAFSIAISVLLYGVDHIVVAIIALYVASFCNSVLYPIQSCSLNQLIPSEQRATLISLNSMAFSLGMVVLFPLVGAFADCFGLSNVLLHFGVILSVGIILYGWRKKKKSYVNT